MSQETPPDPAVGHDGPADPDILRADIERTRADLGETIEALAARTDVRARARHAVDHAADQARDEAHEVRERVSELAAGVGDRVRAGATSVREAVHDADVSATVRRPVPLGAIAAGAALVGAAIYLLRRRRS